jgi:hypothetical protein
MSCEISPQVFSKGHDQIGIVRRRMLLKERIRRVTRVVADAIRDPQPARVAEANELAAQLLPELRIHDPAAAVWLLDLRELTAAVHRLGDALAAQRYARDPRFFA